MISYRFEQLVRLTGGTLNNSHHASASFNGVVIDSRKATSNNLFIAIKGDNKDGHDFIDQVVSNGVAGVLANMNYPKLEHITGKVAVVGVNDTHEAMIKLAADYRKSLAAKFIGITGSNGKTTTKEFTASLLRAFSEKVYASPGNLNNLYGVPLSIFGISNEIETVVLELGISTKNEMPRLAEMVKPDAFIFTNIGASHLEFLASKTEVARAKLRMLDFAGENSPVVINADDEILMAEIKKLHKDFVTFGINSEAQFKPSLIESLDDGRTKVVVENNLFVIDLPGHHQVYNLLAGYACLRAIGYDFTNIETEKLKFSSAAMRGEIVESAGITFMLDCYNANPESMKASLKTFNSIKSDKRKVIILGDMLELGEKSAELHRALGQLLGEMKFDLLITVGPMAHAISNEFKSINSQIMVVHYESSEIAAQNIHQLLRENDLTLMKASRGVALEKIYNAYKIREDAA